VHRAGAAYEKRAASGDDRGLLKLVLDYYDEASRVLSSIAKPSGEEEVGAFEGGLGYWLRSFKFLPMPSLQAPPVESLDWLRHYATLCQKLGDENRATSALNKAYEDALSGASGKGAAARAPRTRNRQLYAGTLQACISAVQCGGGDGHAGWQESLRKGLDLLDVPGLAESARSELVSLRSCLVRAWRVLAKATTAFPQLAAAAGKKPRPPGLLNSTVEG
jgi:hypothetical protein